MSLKRNLGFYGEYLTYKQLKSLEKIGARFLFNVYLPKNDGKTTEIDIIMICPKGLFVFESKNYSGWIFGNENRDNWYQTLPKSRGTSHKERFFNPIIQNRSHIQHLRAFLGEQSLLPMSSIIVFSNRCTLKNIQISSSDVYVIKCNNVISVVLSILNNIPIDILTEDTVTEIYNMLYPYTQVNESVKKEHINNFPSDTKNQSAYRIPAPICPPTDTSVVTELPITENKIANSQFLKCPICNGNLILRTTKRGKNTGKQFYGCSNFPMCRYTRNIN